nr:MAG TPA_asm: Flavivirus envelope glycoprotein M [Caudoviricetes sp.]
MIIDFIKEAGMALVWILLGYFIGESNARKDKK